MPVKKYFENLISSKEARMTEIKGLIEKSESIEEVRSLGKEKENLENEIAEARTQLQALEQSERLAASRKPKMKKGK